MKKLMMKMIIIIVITEKPLVNENKDVGMAKHFSKKYGNKG